MERYVCIHGHFYQPPRENPWLEAVELQESAHPYHDWNERITAECYGPNTAARILNHKGHISGIVNNYAKMSFNFGPTLLSWLEIKAPDVYQEILKADQDSLRQFSGHGSALAQTYNHMIMPLTNRRDRETQVKWGISDFEFRFKRKPEGMWLPETAVDLETLDIMAENGIKFTILDSSQARSFRKKGTEKWASVDGGKIDSTRAYEVSLPSERTIAIFFYDGPISRAVAFERLLNNGEIFANRLLGGFSDKRNWPQLINIATDGESYGHHHRYGEMALAYALDYIEKNKLAKLTNYGEYLERCPPTYDVKIIENTAWSCVHGVGRWKSDCGCNSGGHPGWTQSWREPLRNALDWLREELAPRYERKIKEILKDPWIARDQYISVILDRSPQNIDQFFWANQHHDLNEDQRIFGLKLLELERHAMLMYTSCGWFFDELSGIETVQIIQYAGRALQLAKEVFEEDLEAGFVDHLARAKSNIPQNQDGHTVYDKFVKPALVNLEKVGAHYAISSLFKIDPEKLSTYSFEIQREDYQSWETGHSKLAVGRLRVRSDITFEHLVVTFGVLHQGDQNLSGGVRPFQNMDEYEQTVKDLHKAFSKADFLEVIRGMDKHFGTSTYSLRSLFKDEQRTIIEMIIGATIKDSESVYRHLYEKNAPLMSYLMDLNIPLPRPLQAATELVLNENLKIAISAEKLDMKKISDLLYEAKRSNIRLDLEELSFAMEQSLSRVMDKLRDGASNTKQLSEAEKACELVASLPFEVNLSKVQNDFFKMTTEKYPALKEKAATGDKNAQTWVDAFVCLGNQLKIHLN